MEKYGIADIGSNTIVLLIYEIRNGKPMTLFHQSTAAHLIDYVDENIIMSQEGIEHATKILKSYAHILKDYKIEYKWADVTEPCRIENREELIQALASTGFEIFPLAGEQEALYDYYGTKFSYPEVTDGIAFDVGGGSTELISFKDSKPIDAISFPLGCVRLAHLPLDTDICMNEIKKTQGKYPSFYTQSNTVIGIGGTMRYIGLVADCLHQTKNTITVEQLRDFYKDALEEEPEITEIIHSVVDPARIPVFLPGIHMILEICEAFHAKTILISATGIREGFLLQMLEEHHLKD